MRRSTRSRAPLVLALVALAAGLGAPVGRAAPAPLAVPQAPALVDPALADRALAALLASPASDPWRGLPGHRPGEVHLLAELAGPADRATLAAVAAAGARVTHAFRAVPWLALRGPASAVATLARLPQVRRLEPDRLLRLAGASAAGVPGVADQSRRGTADLGADALWAAGITGRGVTVGVADTGIDGGHPDLDDQDWRAWGQPGAPKLGSFADCTPARPQVFRDDPPPGPNACVGTPAYDDNGHGTHVAGIAAGSAEGGGPDQHGRYPGVAPEAGLAGAKVCLGAGACLSSSVMAGLEWLATPRSLGGAGAEVVNASLGSGRVYGSPLFPAEQVTNGDAEARLVNALSHRYNVLFTISAGNSGPTLQSVGSPGVAAQALGVGAAVADFDRAAPVEATLHTHYGAVRPEAAGGGASAVATFSSRGPSGDRMIKPDVTAPGSYWVAAEGAAGAETRAADAAMRHGFSADPLYAVLSGTSMSAPAAAGAAALVLDGYRQLTGATPRYHELKAALTGTAGTRAFEGPVTGLISGVRGKTVPGDSPQSLFPIRNAAWVGVTGEGAGRVHAPSALLALAAGVIAHTPQQGALDDRHELQPSWSLDALAPGESATQPFVLRAGPRLAGRTARVTLAVDANPQPRGVRAIPASWFSLPRPASVPRGATASVAPRVAVPPGAAAGLYGATIVARAALGGGATQTLRIPVQLFVPVADPDPAAGRGTVVDGDVWGAKATDYSVPEALNPLGEIHSDWVTFPLRLRPGTSRVDLTLSNPGASDHLDLFVFDDQGREVDSSVSGYAHHAVPGGLAYAPTTPEQPVVVSILDGADAQMLELPSTVWIVVTDSKPAIAPGFARYRLGVDVVAGGPAPPPAPGLLGPGAPALAGIPALPEAPGVAVRRLLARGNSD